MINHGGRLNIQSFIGLGFIGLFANVFFAILMTYFLSENDMLSNPAPKWYRWFAVVAAVIPFVWMIIAAAIVAGISIGPVARIIVGFLKTGEY